MKGFIMKKNMKEAINLYHELKHESNLKINLFFYNSFLGTFINLECAVKCQDYESLENIYRLILNDKSVKPDIITESTYLKGLIK